MDGHAEALIDLAAVARNVEAMRQHVGGVPVMAVVKADGYGHGMVPAAHAAVAGGAQWLGVVHEHEALALRRAGLTTRVLCLLGAPGGAPRGAPGGGDGAAHEAAIRADVDLTVDAVPLLHEIAAAATRAGHPARVHLKIDTGMARGGATPADWPELVAAARSAEAAGNITITGIWSHLACADIPGHPSVGAQLARFTDAVALAEAAGARPEVRHLANTAAALDLPGTWFDLVRPGGAIYGLATIPGGAPDWLRPAMTLRTRLTLVKRVPPGTAVSYGHRYTTQGESTLGLIPLGYAEGIPRHASGVVEVQARDKRWSIAGTVCMDLSVIDFGAEAAETGDEVVLFGPGDSGEPTAQQWADALATVSYEVVTNFAGGVPRTYRGVAYENSESPGVGLSDTVTGAQA
ncbi:MAG: alanine racemase [Streptosporangiaceae bacterium]|jgi:alanine racemase|nr:alanine racemase [Streptosporangiaceae bacterium]